MYEIKWSVKKTQTSKLGRFETVFETLELEGGKEGFYSYVKFAKVGVCILPVLDTGEILLIEQYRRPFHEWLYELPAGTVDEGEQPEETARRELLEETGCVADRLVPWGLFYPSPGSTNERIYLFTAYCHMSEPSRLDKTEHIMVKPTFVKEIHRLLTENKIYHAAAIILLQKFFLNKMNIKMSDRT